jgi:hypothetical protein
MAPCGAGAKMEMEIFALDKEIKQHELDKIVNGK